jgi:hypothetical protein
VPQPGPPATFGKLIAEETKKWGKVQHRPAGPHSISPDLCKHQRGNEHQGGADSRHPRVATKAG